MRKNSGMTLTEILIVLVILGVIAAFGVPTFTRIMEQTRMNEARVNLGIIHMAQKVYQANNATYWDGGANRTAAWLNTPANCPLNVDITANNYPQFTFAGVGANAYSASTTRAVPVGVPPVDWTFTINQTGAINCAGTGCPCSITAGTPMGCAT